MALASSDKWQAGLALGALGALVGMAWYGSKGEVHVPPSPPDRNPKTEYRLRNLEDLEYRMRTLRKDPRGYALPASYMLKMKDQYVDEYIKLFGEAPKPDALNKLTGGL